MVRGGWTPRYQRPRGRTVHTQRQHGLRCDQRAIATISWDGLAIRPTFITRGGGGEWLPSRGGAGRAISTRRNPKKRRSRYKRNLFSEELFHRFIVHQSEGFR